MLSLVKFTCMFQFCTHVRSLRDDSRLWALALACAPGGGDFERWLVAVRRLVAKNVAGHKEFKTLQAAWAADTNEDNPEEICKAFTCLWEFLVTRTQPPPFLAIFIHGIFSDPDAAFGPLAVSMREDKQFSNWLTVGFRYDFHDPIRANADILHYLIQTLTGIQIDLICHSMGGLVGRLAILAGSGPKIRRIFLIGTPNHGAYRTSQLSANGQAAFAMTGLVWAMFPKTGIRDLTRVPDIMRGPIARDAHHALNTEYVTIPGTYFNRERPWWEIPLKGKTQPWLWALDRRLLLLDTILGATIRPPHDGIVEHDSNRFQSELQGSITEKHSALIWSKRPEARRYLHLYLDVCDLLTHVEIQHHPVVISAVKSILLSESLYVWWHSDATSEKFVPKIPPIWDGL